jgi:hypothetical protein
MRLAGTAAYIARLLEEQNQLLREIHLALTGRHASSYRIGPPSAPPTNPSKGADRGRRSANDVWHSTPLSENELIKRRIADRERLASQPTNVPSVGEHGTPPGKPFGDDTA